MPDSYDNDGPTTGTPPGWIDRFGDHPGQIGPYRFKREIGAGGMGVVYEAVHERLGRPVAVKLIKRALSSVEMQRRFGQERDVLAALRHPAIAHIYDAGEFEHEGEQLPYIVMEYIVGAKPVTKHCQQANLGIGAVLEMFEQLFEGLEHAHRRGIIHRDIKPGNILVDSEGRARIIDFGLSLPLGARGAFDSLHTEGGMPAGTLAYMSPEQRTGDPLALDHRTDIYSMALVLFESLAGERPPPASGEKPDLRRYDSRVPPELAEAVRAAMRTNPADRTGSAETVREALKRCREGMLFSAAVHKRVEPERSKDGIVRWVSALVAAAIGAFVVFPLCCGALPLCAAYARWATAIISDTDSGYQKVRVVSITAETLASVEMTGPGNPPVSILDSRAKHGEFMDRLIEGDAVSIAWDLYFTSPTEHDVGFAAGIDRAVERGVPVTLMSRKWTDDVNGSLVTPVLESSGAVVAGGTGNFLANVPWRVDIAARRGEGFVESGFALAAVALIDQPGTHLDVEFREDVNEVRVRLWKPNGAQGRRQSGPTQKFGVTGVRPVNEKAKTVGLLPGDAVAQLMLSIPSDRVLDEATVRYEEVLSMTPNELRSAFEARVVVIGRTDEGGQDFRDHPGGRRIPGVYAHADAIETLIRAKQISVPNDPTIRALSALGGVLGAVCLFRGGRSARFALVFLTIMIVVVALLCLGALAEQWIVYPSPVVLSIGLGSVVGALGWRLMAQARRAAGV